MKGMKGKKLCTQKPPNISFFLILISFSFSERCSKVGHSLLLKKKEKRIKKEEKKTHFPRLFIL